MYDNNRDDIGQYNLILERVKPPANSAQQIFYNKPPIETEAIDLQGDLDVFTFPAVVDDKLQITVSNLGGYHIDPCVNLFAPDGTRVAGVCRAGTSAQITPLQINTARVLYDLDQRA